jgi:hypothetical protein
MPAMETDLEQLGARLDEQEGLLTKQVPASQTPSLPDGRRSNLTAVGPGPGRAPRHRGQALEEAQAH